MTKHTSAGRRGQASDGPLRVWFALQSAASYLAHLASSSNPVTAPAPQNILLGVTGGIAAYKTPDLVRRLRERGAVVQVVMTRAAASFVTPLTLQAVSGRPVRCELLDPDAEAGMDHIELARWADRVLVAPASAHLIARLAHGLADDLLTTLYLCFAGPVLIAPAMNPDMWAKPAVQRNVQQLSDDGVTMVMPDDGWLSCRRKGPGRMAEPARIQLLIEATLEAMR